MTHRDQLIEENMDRVRSIVKGYITKSPNLRYLEMEFESGGMEELVMTVDAWLESSADDTTSLDMAIYTRIIQRCIDITRHEQHPVRKTVELFPKGKLNEDIEEVDYIDSLSYLAETDFEFAVLSRVCKTVFGDRPAEGELLVGIATELSTSLDEVELCIECLSERYERFYQE